MSSLLSYKLSIWLLVSPSFLIPSPLYRCQISPNALYTYLTHTELTGHALKILQNAAALFKLLSTLSPEASHDKSVFLLSTVREESENLRLPLPLSQFTCLSYMAIYISRPLYLSLAILVQRDCLDFKLCALCKAQCVVLGLKHLGDLLSLFSPLQSCHRTYPIPSIITSTSCNFHKEF